MSLENLKEYSRRCAEDPDLRDRATEIGVSDFDAHMSLAEGLGLDWYMDDVIALGREVLEAEGEIEDLTEERLAEIVGGVKTVADSGAGVTFISVAANGAVVAGSTAGGG